MGRDERHNNSLEDNPTHPPLQCNEKEFEEFGLWKEEVQNFVLKSQLSLSLSLSLSLPVLLLFKATWSV
jgi:hypothetical protein